MRSVGGTEGVIEEERLVRRNDLRVLDERQRLVGDVHREVVALLRQLRLLHGVVVVGQVGIPLVRLSAQEAVEALEPAAERPVLLRRGVVHLVLGAKVPLPDDVGIPAELAEHRRDHRALTGNVTAGVREPRRRFRDARHRVGRVITPRQQTGTRRRAERRRVEVRVQQSAIGDPLDVRRLDQTTERFHRREPDIVENDVEHVRRVLRRHRLRIRRPIGNRVLDVDIDRALERRAHETSPLSDVLAGLTLLRVVARGSIGGVALRQARTWCGVEGRRMASRMDLARPKRSHR